MNDQVEQIRADQCRQWRAGNRVPVETYLEQHPDLRASDELAVDLIYSEFLLREELGEAPSGEEYLERFSQYSLLLRRQLQLHEALRDASLSAASSALARRLGTEPTAGVSGEFPPTLPDAGPVGAAGVFPVIPGFDFLGLLGSGGRGVVYRARQLSLDRVV